MGFPVPGWLYRFSLRPYHRVVSAESQIGIGGNTMKHVSFKAPLLAAVVGFCLSSACWGQSEKLSKELQGTDVPEELDVIVQYKQAPTSADHRKVTARGGIHRNTFN